jgi:hypothetical protein
MPRALGYVNGAVNVFLHSSHMYYMLNETTICRGRNQRVPGLKNNEDGIEFLEEVGLTTRAQTPFIKIRTKKCKICRTK